MYHNVARIGSSLQVHTQPQQGSLATMQSGPGSNCVSAGEIFSCFHNLYMTITDCQIPIATSIIKAQTITNSGHVPVRKRQCGLGGNPKRLRLGQKSGTPPSVRPSAAICMIQPNSTPKKTRCEAPTKAAGTLKLCLSRKEIT